MVVTIVNWPTVTDHCCLIWRWKPSRNYLEATQNFKIYCYDIEFIEKDCIQNVIVLAMELASGAVWRPNIWWWLQQQQGGCRTRARCNPVLQLLASSAAYHYMGQSWPMAIRHALISRWPSMDAAWSCRGSLIIASHHAAQLMIPEITTGQTTALLLYWSPVIQEGISDR